MTSKPQVESRILEKIKYTLNLANAQDDHESQTAMLLAQQMMAKYGLEMDDIDVDTGQPVPKEVMEMYATRPGTLYWWQKRLSSVVADNFKCFTFYRTRNRKSRVIFLGLKEDTQIAREVFLYAQDSIEYLSIKYLDSNGIEGMSERTAIRNDYIMGFISGLAEKFKEQVAQNEWGLVLVKDDAVIERHEKLNIVKGSSSSVSRSGNSDAIEAGYSDGKNMDHSKRSLKG